MANIWHISHIKDTCHHLHILRVVTCHILLYYRHNSGAITNAGALEAGVGGTESGVSGGSAEGSAKVDLVADRRRAKALKVLPSFFTIY